MTTIQSIVLTLLVCFLGITAFVVTQSLLDSKENTTSRRDDIVVECKATVDGWIFRKQGPDGVLHSDDDPISRNLLLLPQHSTVQLQMTSDDYLFRLSQKELNLNTIAVPNHQITTMIDTGKPGLYDLESQPMCGTPFFHGNDQPQIIVTED
jgi:heme/copper-type cytochrome/quinol oxidase subunit 2